MDIQDVDPIVFTGGESRISPMPEQHGVPWQDYVDQSFAAQQHAVEIALVQVQEALNKNEALQVERVEAVRREVRLALDAATIAIDKQDAAAEKRFTSIDELRSQLSTLNSIYMLKEVAESRLELINKALQGLDNIKANEQLQLERMEALRREHFALQLSNKEAIDKSEAATEKRFDSVNEFRAQLSDQASRFMPREVAEALISEQSKLIAALSSRLDLNAGASANGTRTIGYAIAALGLLITVVIFLVNFAFDGS